MAAGIAGQTAALHARRKLGSAHSVIVVSPNSKWNWIPSNIWVGVGSDDTGPGDLPAASPSMREAGIEFHQAKAVCIHPEGNAVSAVPYVTVEYTDPDRKGQQARPHV